MSSLVDHLARVTDRASFLTFVAILAADRHDSVAQERNQPGQALSPDAGGWENITIESFLEAALAWAQDTQMSAVPSWRAFADFLYAGKIYE